ncbi:MAG: hypothetical protein IH987_07620 [Planctomycetes bacterium]|nr:hypothetical protein [Planctomycetota bacterium]
MVDRLNNTKDTGHRPGFSLVESVVVLLTGVLLVAMIQPSLASARRHSKFSVCLDRLAVIGAATAIYTAEDPDDNALPVPSSFFTQNPSRYTNIGAYEWGGKAGKGAPGWTSGAGGQYYFLTGRYGTKAGFGPATRPLNNILYPHGFVEYGPPNYIKEGAILDTQLQLDAVRCPADDGPPEGGHCVDWVANPEQSSFDYFGTSYNANIFMTSFVGGGPISSNSQFLGPVSRVPDPARTLAYHENIGRWAWTTKRLISECSVLIGFAGIDPGPTKAVRGWHGKNWTFNRSFVDGHVATQKILIEGSRDSNGYFNHYRLEVVYPDDPNLQQNRTCIIVRGDGWQLDTLPAEPIPTGYSWNGSGRLGECLLPQ